MYPIPVSFHLRSRIDPNNLGLRQKEAVIIMSRHPKTPDGICAPLNVNAADRTISARRYFPDITSQPRDFEPASRLSHANIVIHHEIDIWQHKGTVPNRDFAEGSDAIETAQDNFCPSVLAGRYISKFSRDWISDGSGRYSYGAAVEDRGFPSDIRVGDRQTVGTSLDGIEGRESCLAGVDGCGPAIRANAATEATHAGSANPQGIDDASLMARARSLRDAFYGLINPEAVQVGAEILRRSIAAAAIDARQA